jgi:ABC-type glycerol-3-phosphate transport system substrate-binding protein
MKYRVLDKGSGVRHRRNKFLLIGTALSTLALGLSSLVGVGATGASTSKKPTLTVWVDATRVPAIKDYIKAHPNVHVKLVVYDGDLNEDGTLQTKVGLFNRAGSGWPDVVFSTEFNDIASLTDSNLHFAARLDKGLVPTSVINHFAKGSLAVCDVNGHLYCLRNDIGQDVLWYNATLMKQFGYTVPTTWEQYQALGEQVAAQHPGYIIGDAGNAADDEVYLQSNQCPINETVNSKTVVINPNAGNCSRIINLIDPLIKDGSISTEALFSSTFDTQFGAKTLMMIGASWYGQFIFHSATALNVPAGQVAAAAPLKWAGSSTTTTGDLGGGIWMVSSHSKYPAAAGALATWVATNPAYQTTGPTYPAYVPASVKWIAAVVKQGYFANNIAPVLAQAATEIWTKWDVTNYAPDSVWSSTVLPALTAGQSLASIFPTFASTLTNLAQSDGYTVVTKP